MGSIEIAIAEILRPVVALLVKGMYHAVVLLVFGPLWLLQAMYRQLFYKGLGKQDRLRTARFHDTNSHQASKWTQCGQCASFISLAKSVGDARRTVTDETMKAQKSAMSRFHKQQRHQGPSWSDCGECVKYLEQSTSELRLAISRTIAEGIAEAVMPQYHTQSSHRQESWTDCRACVKLIEQMDVGPLDALVPSRS